MGSMWCKLPPYVVVWRLYCCMDIKPLIWWYVYGFVWVLLCPVIKGHPYGCCVP